MICFRKYTTLLLIGIFQCFNLGYSQIQEKVEVLDTVVPLNEQSKEITNGEIYTVKIISEKNFEELEKYKNKKINEIMYVMDLNRKPDGNYFKVFVTDPPKKPKKKIDFALLGFQYKPTNKGMGQDFYAFASDFKLNNSVSSYGWYIGVLLLIVILGFSPKLIKLYKNYKRKKYLRKQTLIFSRELLEKVRKAQTRKDFEKIYSDRKVIQKFLDIDHGNFVKFLNTLAAIQYKREWSEKECELINNLFKEIRYFKVRSGI